MRMSLRRVGPSKLLLLLLLICQPVAAVAQGAVNTLRQGDEVQVHAPAVRGQRVRGTVVLYQGSTLTVREAATGSMVAIPVADIRLLARNQGTDRSRSSWRMARLGGFVGGAAGFVTGPLIATTRAPDNFTEVTVVSGIVGTAAGAGLGAVAGALFARDQWQRFRMPIVPTVATGPGVTRIGFSAPSP
jgi:hypothetical protein